MAAAAPTRVTVGRALLSGLQQSEGRSCPTNLELTKHVHEHWGCPWAWRKLLYELLCHVLTAGTSKACLFVPCCLELWLEGKRNIYALAPYAPVCSHRPLPSEYGLHSAWECVVHCTQHAGLPSHEGTCDLIKLQIN